MRLSELFHAVKTGTPAEKLAFWKLCKASAVSNGPNELVGLAKIALDIWADSYQAGESPSASREVREAFSGSFGSAAAVDRHFHKMASEGFISEDELEKLSEWVAESAVSDLHEITKTAAGNVLLQPQVLGALTGAAIGAGVGAWHDKDNRARGAITGILPGAVMGATLMAKAPIGGASGTKKKAHLSAKLADVMQGLDQGGQPPMNTDMPSDTASESASGEQPAPENEQSGEAIGEPDQGQTEAMEDVDRGHQVVDNMVFLANQVQLPQLAQDMQQQREMLAGHFAEGNAYLPPELQHHFAQSEHAEAFMKKYKQRFGALTSGGSKKTAGVMESLKQQVDSLRGRAPGGIDMKEMRRYAPDAEYLGMIPGHDGRIRPGIRSLRTGVTSTWNPELIRHMLNVDAPGTYHSLSRDLYGTKTAAQDEWISWRTHR